MEQSDPFIATSIAAHYPILELIVQCTHSTVLRIRGERPGNSYVSSLRSCIMSLDSRPKEFPIVYSSTVLHSLTAVGIQIGDQVCQV